ncbi:MAG: hypothetical protein WCF85_17355 [Rhodospirillaceae bacterium]
MDRKENPRREPGAGNNGTQDSAIVTSITKSNQPEIAVARAKQRWLLAADRLADAADPVAARHELRELRLYFRELAYAAAATGGVI